MELEAGKRVEINRKMSNNRKRKELENFAALLSKKKRHTENLLGRIVKKCREREKKEDKFSSSKLK